MSVGKYSYNQLYELIRQQTEKENKEKKKKDPSYGEEVGENLFRFFSGPTSQNLDSLLSTAIQGQTKKGELEDRSKYIHISSRI